MRAMSGVQGEQKGKDKVEDRERETSIWGKKKEAAFF